jgi:hypothetical protein
MTDETSNSRRRGRRSGRARATAAAAERAAVDAMPVTEAEVDAGAQVREFEVRTADGDETAAAERLTEVRTRPPAPSQLLNGRAAHQVEDGLKRQAKGSSVQSEASREVWRAVLAGDPQALPDHSPEWVDAICSGGRFEDATRHYEFGGERRFVLPLVRRRGPAGVGGWLGSYPTGWGSGGLLGADLDPRVVRTVVDDLRSLGTARVVIRPDPLRAAAWTAARGPGVTVVPRRAHVADLSGGLAAVRAQLPSMTRRNLRTAEKRGVRIEVDRNGRLLPVYYRLHLMSVTRWARKQHEPLTLARWRARRQDPLEKFHAISRNMGDAFRLFVAFVDDRPAAAVLVLFGRTARYMRGAMDRDLAASTRANDALQMAAIEQACVEGCGTYHLGESGASASLARFKERFGAVPVDYSEYRIERFPITAAESAARTAVKKVLRFRDM